MLDLSAGAEARARSGSNVDAEQWRHSVTGATRFKVHGDVKKVHPLWLLLGSDIEHRMV